MKEILSLHPNVASHPFEYRFIIDPDGIVDFYTTALNCWSPYIIDQKLHRLELFLTTLAEKWNCKETYVDWELNQHLPDYERLVNALMEDLVDFKYRGVHYGLRERRDLYFMGHKTRNELTRTLGGFIRSLIDGYLKQRGREIYVEDNTFNLLFARELLDLLPEAKFIHMMREPMDIIASLSKQRWAPTDKVNTARWYKEVISQIEAVKQTIPRKSLMVVDLYELVDDKERVLTELCTFLGVSFSDEMLDIDLSKSNRGRWKDEFTDDELVAVQRVLGGA
jgi:hypothetical protein